MNREQPSTTAVITAARRGDHRLSDPAPRIPGDPLVLMLAGPERREALQPGRSAFGDGTRPARPTAPRDRRANAATLGRGRA
jgi:hypothetical protein